MVILASKIRHAEAYSPIVNSSEPNKNLTYKPSPDYIDDKKHELTI